MRTANLGRPSDVASSLSLSLLLKPIPGQRVVFVVVPSDFGKEKYLPITSWERDSRRRGGTKRRSVTTVSRNTARSGCEDESASDEEVLGTISNVVRQPRDSIAVSVHSCPSRFWSGNETKRNHNKVPARFSSNKCKPAIPILLIPSKCLSLKSWEDAKTG